RKRTCAVQLGMSAMGPIADTLPNRRDINSDVMNKRSYRACPKTSDSLAGSALSPSDMNSGFLGGVRTSLHIIDESSKLRHDVAASGIIKKHARQHGRERFQYARESSRFHRCSGDRPRHLRKTQT